MSRRSEDCVDAVCSIEEEMCDECGEDIRAGEWRVELIDPDEWLHVHCAEARGWEVHCDA